MRHLFALLSLILAAALLPAAASAQGRDWRTNVVRDADGSYLVGNPAAKVTLVEYLSFTCSHCRDFVTQSKAELRDGLVRRGVVRVHKRNAVLNQLDLAAALLTRCAGPRNYLAMHDVVFANQDALIAGAQAIPASELTGDIHRQLPVMASRSGLSALFAARGMNAGRVNRCLSDAAELKRVTDGAQAAFTKIEGTPSFEIDGTLAPNVHRWSGLSPLLAAAVAR